MTKVKYIMWIILLIGAVLFVMPTIVNAADTQTATSQINGVEVQWSYTLNDAGQIENLKCTNPTALTGDITIPSQLSEGTVIGIGDEAFKSATNITGVTISNSITTIGYGAFSNCANLSNVDLGKITSISFDVFKNCPKLTSIKVPNTLKNGSVGPCFNNTNITNITFEEGLTTIPSYLCANTGVASVIIPSSVTNIDYNAFSNCANLSNVDLGKITSISFDVFKNCPKLTSIKIPKTLINGIEIAVGSVFSGTTILRSVTFEDGISIIPGAILSGCSGITSVSIPNSVTKIRQRAFEGTSISEIEIPNSVTEIGEDAFKDCSKLKKVTILDNCTHIGFFILYPTRDTVFTNHIDELTIYCYEGSKIAEYAISNNIKYVYLTNQNADKTFNNHRYRIIDKLMTWKEAKAYCESIGGYLVTITSKEEQAFLQSLIKEKGFTKNRFWIGATDEEKEGTWKWVTGEKFSYTNWGKGQPNNTDKGEGQNYLALLGYDATYNGDKILVGQWDDLRNNSEDDIYFICEWGDVESQAGNSNSDQTIASGKLPQTGVGIGVIVSLIVSISIGVFSYLKIRKYKDV